MRIMESSKLANHVSKIKELMYLFNSGELPALSHVGGKGLSLIVMTQCGLPVPPGNSFCFIF